MWTKKMVSFFIPLNALTCWLLQMFYWDKEEDW